MMLGDLLRRLADEDTAEAALIDLGDLALVAAVDAARGPFEESRAEYVAGAARRFADQADHEAWQSLTRALEGTAAPAAACLATMLRWAVRQDGHQHAAQGCGR